MMRITRRTGAALAALFLAGIGTACSSDNGDGSPTSTSATQTTGGAGSSGAGVATGAGSSSGGSTGASATGSASTVGSGGNAGTGGIAGAANGGGGSGGASGSGGSAASDGGVSDGGVSDGGPVGDSSVTDPGTDGDGRYPMNRPPNLPADVQGRLMGVQAGPMRTFQIPAAMGFSARTGQVYTPATYAANTPVAFMVFHDGTSLASSENIPIVIDNLIFEKKIPMMVAIFIPPVDRSREYDTVNDNFTRYLTTQALPAVNALGGIRLTTDPEASGACGHSSGGILAFTMAWFEPDRYRRVLSFSGSFTHLQTPGGDLYDDLVRTTMPLKPIRTAMTAGTNDLLAPRWTQANETMGAALMAAGYHYRYILINGGTHDQASSRPWVADLMTWLWRGYPITGPTH